MTNYPSNLSDKQWNLVKSFLPKSKSGGYERKHSRREMLNAIFYLNKTSCQCRDFTPWKSVYSYFRRLCTKNIFEKINSYLNIQIKLKDGRDPTSSWGPHWSIAYSHCAYRKSLPYVRRGRNEEIPHFNRLVTKLLGKPSGYPFR